MHAAVSNQIIAVWNKKATTREKEGRHPRNLWSEACAPITQQQCLHDAALHLHIHNPVKIMWMSHVSWKKTGVPGGNQSRHGESMHTQKDSGWESNQGSFYCKGTVRAIGPPCCLVLNLFILDTACIRVKSCFPFLSFANEIASGEGNTNLQYEKKTMGIHMTQFSDPFPVKGHQHAVKWCSVQGCLCIPQTWSIFLSSQKWKCKDLHLLR